MGMLDRLERRLERAVRTVFSAGGSGKIKPVEIANTIRLQMDREAMALSQGRTLAPNVFEVIFNEDNFDQVKDWGTPLAEELCDEAIRHAAEQGYTLQGPVQVSFNVDEDVSRGNIKVRARTKASEKPVQQQSAPQQYAQPAPRQQVAPQAQPATRNPQPPENTQPLTPVVEVGGARYALNSSSAVLGRAADVDITIDDPGISRRHLEIRHDGAGQVHAVDLGSTNGFYVNGQKINHSTPLHHGDVLTAGRTRIVFRMIPGNPAHSTTSGGRR